MDGIVDRRLALDLAIKVAFPSITGTITTAVNATVLIADRQMGSAYIEMYAPSVTGNSEWVQYIATGVPVLLSWTARGKTGMFAGYVHTASASNDQLIQIMAVGMGYPLHRSTGRAMADASTKSVVAAICSDHLLDFSVNPRAAQQLNMVQGDLSDWQWLLKVSARDGSSLHFRGATLVVQPFDYFLSSSVKAPVDIVIPTGGINRTTSRSSSPVRSWTNKGSTIVDGTVANPATAYGMVTSMGEVTNVVVSGTSQTQVSLDAVSSPFDALQFRAEKDIADRWTTRASVVMDGVPNLYPLDLVRTASERVRTVDTAWSALSVKHVLGENDYVVEVELGQEKAYREGSPTNLLSLPVDRVNPFNRLRTQSIGNSPWYSTPTLRPTSSIRHGSQDYGDPSSWRWTTEQVLTR